MGCPIAEIHEITHGNRPGAFELRPGFPVEASDLLVHIFEDVHHLLRLVTEHDKLLKEFGPMIEAWRRTNGGTIGLVRARKAARNGRI